MDYSGQFDILPVDTAKKTPVRIIGAGNSGSWEALFLAKSGFFSDPANPLHICDHDIIEERNFNNQFYPLEAVGQLKVEALAKELQRFAEAHIVTHPYKFDPEKFPTDGIVINATDSMEARLQIFEACIKNPNCRLFIDTRTGGSLMEMYVINPQKRDHQEFYMGTWKSDAEIGRVPCTNVGVAWTSASVGYWVCATIFQHMVGITPPIKHLHDNRNLRDIRHYADAGERPAQVSGTAALPTSVHDATKPEKTDEEI